MKTGSLYKILAPLTLVSCFIAPTYASKEETGQETQRISVKSQILSINMFPDRNNVRAAPGFSETAQAKFGVGFERSRKETSFIYLNLCDYVASYLINGVDSYDPELSLYKQGKTKVIKHPADLSEGDVSYFKCLSSLNIDAVSIDFSGSLFEIDGCFKLTCSDISLTQVKIMPVGNLVFRPRDPECPIRKIKITPANNQIPTLLHAKLTLDRKPKVYIEALNANSIDIIYKKQETK